MTLQKLIDDKMNDILKNCKEKINNRIPTDELVRKYLKEISKNTIDIIESEIDKLDRHIFKETCSEHEYIDTCYIYKTIQKLRKDLK